MGCPTNQQEEGVLTNTYMKFATEHYEAVKKWNLKCGNRTEEYGTIEFWRSTENQTKLVLEEVKETLEALELGDSVALLDGILDIRFVLDWLTEQVTQAGFDVDGAMKAVIDNNNTKIFNTYTAALETAEYHESLGVDGVYIKSSLINGKDYFTVRNINGKIMKPIGFQSVELKQYCPKE